mgnify:CR=1 FL=1
MTDMGRTEAELKETRLYKKLEAALGTERLLVNERMDRHTTFRIGGPADFFISPDTEERLAEAIRCLKENNAPYFVIGNGSNLLVSDAGYRGTVICLFKSMDGVSVQGNTVRAGAGALLSRVAAEALSASLTGFEFASGIPGTLGGAVVMNAGAYGGEMKDVLTDIRAVAADGTILTLPAEKLELSYRNSAVIRGGLIVTEAGLALRTGDRDAIQARMDELKEARVSKQPLEFPSAGSAFKRPEGHFAGKLIMDAGLAGYHVGDAEVSTKHCGFVINRGHATAAQTRQLIRDVIERVRENSGVTLEPEVKFLGEFE